MCSGPVSPPRSPTPEPLDWPGEGATQDDWLEYFRVEWRRDRGEWPDDGQVWEEYVDSAPRPPTPDPCGHLWYELPQGMRHAFCYLPQICYFLKCAIC